MAKNNKQTVGQDGVSKMVALGSKKFIAQHLNYARNRVGGKRSSFPPTFVFRPLTPPYMRFRIRRFLFWVPFDV